MSSFVWVGIGDSQLCPPPWLNTSGGIMVNTARCASTQAKVAQKWSFRIGSVEIPQASVHSSYLFALFYFPIFPDHQIPICVEIAHAFWFRAPVAVLPGDIFGFGSLRFPMPTESSSGRSINHQRLLNAKNHMAYIYIHYIPMIYLRCQVCKKQTLKHSWSLRFQTIFLIVQFQHHHQDSFYHYYCHYYSYSK